MRSKVQKSVHLPQYCGYHWWRIAGFLMRGKCCTVWEINYWKHLWSWSHGIFYWVCCGAWLIKSHAAKQTGHGTMGNLAQSYWHSHGHPAGIQWDAVWGLTWVKESTSYRCSTGYTSPNSTLNLAHFCSFRPHHPLAGPVTPLSFVPAPAQHSQLPASPSWGLWFSHQWGRRLAVLPDPSDWGKLRSPSQLLNNIV